MNKRILLSSPTMHGDELGYVNEAFERNWIAPLGFELRRVRNRNGRIFVGRGKNLRIVALLRNGGLAPCG